MIKFENTEVFGWEAAIRGMRNPKNSWGNSDTDYEKCYNTAYLISPTIGNNDLDLMKRLVKAGTDHRKFMRMIVVYVDVTAPLYWWKEADTYKVGTVRNSCSTMHKIADKEFTLDDFSHEHLCNNSIKTIEKVIETLNIERNNYLVSKDKWCWWQIIQLLPSSYNQKATLMLNYEVLANIYHSRKNHKLDEWVEFCKWIETLPYSELIIGDKK